jgi:MinD-like ATPase involved in chromosome partitioning or flagellar assembly
MQTITFYSYKGGVGRTLALANIAVYLSRFRQDVCIVDFDLEAPGLHYKFPQFLEPSKIQMGLVDYIYKFTYGRIVPQSLSEFSLMLSEKSESTGEIRLIPAGNAFSYEYWRKLASIDWHSLFYERNSEGVPFFLELKERVREEFRPDFLLIDSRTGITEMSSICTYLLPEKVVFLTINNQENIEGARQILRSIQRIERFPGQEPIDIIFALTRIPFPKDQKETEEQEQILQNVKKLLNEPVEDLKSQLEVRNIFMLHSDRDLELSESLRISQQGAIKETVLSRDYLNLFSAIVPFKIIEKQIRSVVEQITNKIWDSPETAQKELEEIAESNPFPIVLERLIMLYMLQREDERKIVQGFHRLYESSGSISSPIFSRYVSLFLEKEDYFKGPKYNLQMLQEYLDANPNDKLRYNLAKAYYAYGNYEMAFRYYSDILGSTEEIQIKEAVLSDLLDICIKRRLFDKAKYFLETHKGIIDETKNESLYAKRVETLLAMRSWRALGEIADKMDSTFAKKHPELYLLAMVGSRRGDKAKTFLNTLAMEAATAGEWARVEEIGVAFRQAGMLGQFEWLLKDTPIPKGVLDEIRAKISLITKKRRSRSL